MNWFLFWKDNGILFPNIVTILSFIFIILFFIVFVSISLS